jgi:beta-galactosidase
MFSNLGGQLTLFGRDAKIHIVEYDVGNIKLVYSTAEVFTWSKGASGKTMLILYAGAAETHEIMLLTVGKPILPKNSEINIEKRGTAWIL